MTGTDYQKAAARTLGKQSHTGCTFNSPYSEWQIDLVWNALGLVGEAGEVAEYVKKGVFHGKGIQDGSLLKELGDVLWYVAAICTVLEIDMGDVMETNIAKLKARYPDGWDANRSHAAGAVPTEERTGDATI